MLHIQRNRFLAGRDYKLPHSGQECCRSTSAERSNDHFTSLQGYDDYIRVMLPNPFEISRR